MSFILRLLQKRLKTSLIILNKKLCDELKLDYKNLESSEEINFLSGNLVLKNSDPLAMVYAGHQFGNWCLSWEMEERYS